MWILFLKELYKMHASGKFSTLSILAFLNTKLICKIMPFGEMFLYSNEGSWKMHFKKEMILTGNKTLM